MKLRIQLLSDFCTGSGEGFNSTVDTDAVFDDYGFPYIPAKRLKGCMRESCLELEELGVIPQGSVISIFGKEGDQPSLFSLSDAYPEHYEEMVSDLIHEEDRILTSYQNVTGLYSYVRTQTSLDPNTGVAEKNSLRTIRVVKKGMVFESDLVVSPRMSKEQRGYLESGIKLVTHMGIHRTRGLGIVKITLQESQKEDEQRSADWKFGEKNKISYSILLKSPLLNKSPEGNQTRTQEYIEGGKVLGLLAGALGKESFQNMMQDELIVSNAYIMCGDKRCTPLPASLQKRKDQVYDEEGKMNVVDMLYTDGIQEQMTPVGVKFADPDGHVVNVDTEIHYHHRRPEDKSIGHANGLDGSAFYQMASIRKGQRFGGVIIATKKQAETVCQVLSSAREARIGYGRNAQYGAAELSIVGVEIIKEEEKAERVHDFQVKLNAPVILYNDNGMCSADTDMFCKYLSEELHADGLVLEKTFVTYETVGGFNVTWKRRKPIFNAIGKGSVFTFHSDAGVSVKNSEIMFLGERVSEGYGEIIFSTERNGSITLSKANGAIMPEGKEYSKTNLISMLAKTQCRHEIQAEAIREAEEAYRKLSREKEADSVVSRLIQICREQNNVKDMATQADSTESDKKRELTQPLTKRISEALTKEYPSKRRVEASEWFEDEEIYALYSRTFLQHIKYLLRPDREERREERRV